MEKFKKKKILIIGGASLLGINFLVSSFNLYDSYLSLNKKIVKIKNTKSIKINFDHIKSTEKKIYNINPDIVINFVALTDVNKCEKNKKLAYKLNASIPLILSKICNNLKCKMIHISTDQLFNEEKTYYSEKSKVSLINNYSKTKYLGERNIINVCKKYLILRTNFFGYGTMYKKSYSDYIINELKNKNKIYLSDKIIFNPIYIGNLIKIINFLIANNARGIFNVSADNSLSKFKFGIELCKRLKIKHKNINIEDNKLKTEQVVKRPLNMTLSNKKLKKIYKKKIGTVEKNIEMMILDNKHKEILKKYTKI